MSENSPSREPERPTVKRRAPSCEKIFTLPPSEMAISRASIAARCGRSNFSGKTDFSLPEPSRRATLRLRASRHSRSLSASA